MADQITEMTKCLKKLQEQLLQEKLFGKKDFGIRCDSCGKSYKHKESLSKHRKRHCGSESPHHKCDQCEKAYYRPDCLKKHKMRDHEKKQFTCEFCGLKYNDERYVRVHMRQHTGE